MSTPAPPETGSSRETAPSEPTLIRIGARQPLGRYLREMWDRRDFAYTVAVGQLRADNQNTVLGSAWHLLNPLMLAGVYYLVFGVIFGARGAIHDNYVAFLIIGLFTFYFSQKVVMGGTRVITTNLDLIRNVRFPRALLPIASTLQQTYAQLPALLAMLVIVYFTGDDLARLFGAGGVDASKLYLSWYWLLLVPIVIVQSVFNLGASFVVARLTFHFRDMQFIVSYVMRLLFYTSGVFFSINEVDEILGNQPGGDLLVQLFAANPFYAFIHLTREAVMNGATDPRFWRIALLWAVGTSVLGLFFFRRRELEYSHA